MTNEDPGELDWQDVSTEAREVMKELGDFGPTVDPQKAELKGWAHDEYGTSKTYWGPKELRRIAAACIEVAGWLEKRGPKGGAA